MTTETTTEQTDVQLVVDKEDTAAEDAENTSAETDKNTENDENTDDNDKDKDTTIEETSTLKSSIFGDKEGRVALAWLLYTMIYWTLLMWIPTLITMSFQTTGLIIWCIGCIGFMSCSYTLYEGKYPSGATKENELETNSIGRYTCCLLTTAVIIDVCILIFYSVVIADKVLVADGIRLFFHCIQILWTSLFFYNRFYRYHNKLATRAFIIQWLDIIWTCLISFILNEVLLEDDEDVTAVHWVYFIAIILKLCGWMFPMMFIPTWGTQKYAQTVSLHLLVLDVCTNIPIIVTLKVENAYKSNAMLFIDLFWKSFLIIRSISYYFVSIFLYKSDQKSDNEEDNDNEDEVKDNETEKRHEKRRKYSTFAWVFYVGVYWTILTIAGLSTNPEWDYRYWIWMVGMIGVLSVGDTLAYGYNAVTRRGRAMIALSCLSICTDWILYAFNALYSNDNGLDGIGYAAIFCHSVAIFIALLFFYENAVINSPNPLTTGKINIPWISMLLEWVDILFMYIVILILAVEISGNGCFSYALCVGYFIIVVIKTYFWFFPIIFGYSEEDAHIHIHMVALDTLTDLPLIIIIVASDGYSVHWFLFVDIAFKLVMLLRCYAYHLVVNLILKKKAKQVESSLKTSMDDKASTADV